uniref:Proline-rich protein 36-like n=1 Tax=Phascolarctos cinereus TaxID=38626 RepID=A0A6P5J581_PHACI|nr:proline-rich protein 36-like [Phascolarctos cinereus]
MEEPEPEPEPESESEQEQERSRSRRKGPRVPRAATLRAAGRDGRGLRPRRPLPRSDRHGLRGCSGPGDSGGGCCCRGCRGCRGCCRRLTRARLLQQPPTPLLPPPPPPPPLPHIPPAHPEPRSVLLATNGCSVSHSRQPITSAAVTPHAPLSRKETRHSSPLPHPPASAEATPPLKAPAPPREGAGRGREQRAESEPFPVAPPIPPGLLLLLVHAQEILEPSDLRSFPHYILSVPTPLQISRTACWELQFSPSPSPFTASLHFLAAGMHGFGVSLYSFIPKQ